MKLDHQDLSAQDIRVHDLVVRTVTYDHDDPTVTRIEAQRGGSDVEFVLSQQPHSQLPEIMQVVDGEEKSPEPELAQALQEWVRYDLARIAPPPAPALDLSPMPMADWDAQMGRPSLDGVTKEAVEIAAEHAPKIDTGSGLNH